MVRTPCDKLNMRKGLWIKEEEDERTFAHGTRHGTGNWNIVARKAGLKRCGKSSRLRYTNYQRGDTRDESFTPQEEDLIIRLHAAIGSRWYIIAQQLPGRTDNEVKNYWNTKLKKRLSEMGIDHVTHKPFSQILADYGNMGGLPKPGTRIGPLNRDFKNAFILKPEQYMIPSEGFTNFNTNFIENPNQDSNSHDLLTQLQAITLVTGASRGTNNETNTPQNDCFSSSSSSSVNLNASPSFSWRDFLIEDPFLAGDQANNGLLSQTQNQIVQNDLKQKEKQIFGAVEENGCKFSIEGFEASSSLDSSFVEAMVDRQNEMFLEFPELMDESFFY